MKDMDFTRCGNCKAYEMTEALGDEERGWCRRRAPSPVVHQIYSDTDLDTDLTVAWPIVEPAIDGCMEGIPR